MPLFWVSAIVYNEGDKAPRLCAMSEGELNLSKAMEGIAFLKQNNRVLSAWVDTYNDSLKSTVYHECFIDAFGDTVPSFTGKESSNA